MEIQSHLAPFARHSAAPLRSLDLDRYSLDLAIAIEAAQEAGQVVAEAYGRAMAHDSKGVGDIVTEVDREADRRTHAYLRRVVPNDRIVSEELPPSGPNGSQRTWYVDPLDGTSAFVFRTDPRQPSVMLALGDEQGLAASVVHFPLTGEWFYAERGAGAFRNGVRLAAPEHEPEMTQSRVVLNHYGHADLETPEFETLRDSLRQPGGAGLVTIEAPHSGSACRVVEPGSTIFAVVHDNNPAKIKQAIWDIAAPRLIIEEAGGAFVDLLGTPYWIESTGPIVVARTPEAARKIIRMSGKAG